MMTLSPWVIIFLFINLPGAYGLTSFPEKFVVAKRAGGETVTLTCTAGPDGPVNWKFQAPDYEAEAVEQSDDITLHGRNLNVRNVEDEMIGEYSCWNGEDEYLQSTYLLFADSSSELTPISCRAKSYNCNFRCNWSHSEFTAVRLGLGPECAGEDTAACRWVSSTGQFPGSFQLDHTLSPFGEEDTELEVTGQAIIKETFYSMSKRFFLRDIVQPDSPRTVSYQEEGQALRVTIHPASSWSRPHSYFNLEHEIEYEYKDGKVERRTSRLIPKEITKMRVRSRDSLVLSPWSQWTAWENTT